MRGKGGIGERRGRIFEEEKTQKLWSKWTTEGETAKGLVDRRALGRVARED